MAAFFSVLTVMIVIEMKARLPNIHVSMHCLIMHDMLQMWGWAYHVRILVHRHDVVNLQS